MKILKVLLIALLPHFSFGQAHHHSVENHRHDKNIDPHHERHPLRLAFLLGHGMVPETAGEGIFFVPTWGLDVDYHINDNWSLGWHSDIELENYKVVGADNEIIELETPVVSTLDVFYRLNHNLLLGVGPGLTREQGEWKSLIRLGLEAEVPLNDRWEWTPTIYVDQRIDGHQVWTVALGVAHYL